LPSDNSLVRRMVLARFRTTYDQLPAEELLVVQLLHGAFRLFNRKHLHKSKPFRTLVVFVRHHFSVLDCTDAIEELKEIALRGIE